MKNAAEIRVLAGSMLIAMVLGLSACATRTQPAAINPFFDKKDVSPEEFTALYHEPRYAWNRAEYLGIYQGYHYMSVYNSLEESGKTRLRYYVRTPMDKLSPFFPSEPQEPIKPASPTTQPK